jgi:hypothetical protein
MSHVVKALEEDGYVYNETGGTATITGYTGAGGNLAIPNQLGGNTVVSIGSTAFFRNSSLTRVTIPNSVTSIGQAAFSHCDKLTGVTIPDGVISIGNSAFALCGSLTSVIIPNTVTIIEPSAFAYCDRLTSVTLPNNITSIGVGVFSHCTNLASVTIPKSVLSIGDFAFEYCSYLAGMTIPNSVTSIGIGAFSYCNGLTSVTIPKNLTSIGREAFLGCSKLTRAIFTSNAPAMGTGVFESTAIGFEILRNEGATGFTGTPWNEYSIVINARPLAKPNSARTLKNIALAVVLSGSDPEGGALTYRIVTAPTKGMLGGTPPNLTYVPNKDVTGADSFTFIVSDGILDSDPATVNLGIEESPPIEDSPPLPWSTKEVGSGKLVGYTKFTSGTFTQAGSGAFGTKSDKFRFTYQTLSGDGEIIARLSKLEDTGGSSRVGVMIRESLATNARHVFVGLTGNGTFFYVERKNTGGKNATTKSGAGTVPNTWLRLVRRGSEVTAFRSINGKKWILVDRVTMILPKNGYIGLASASGSDTKVNTSQFSNVKVMP